MDDKKLEQPPDAPCWSYPPRSDHPDDEIFVYDRWCKCCGICSELCPQGVITVDKGGHPTVSNPDACIACYLCEILCPDMAITVYRKPKKGRAAENGGRVP